MNIRATSNPLVRAAGHWLERVNDRHPWSHNDHFHPWILRSLPAAPSRVLDVGCGRGELAGALIPRAGLVEGIDPDAAMAYATATRFWSEPRVHIARRTLTEQAGEDRKSTRLNSSHVAISYAVFCLKKKTKKSTLTEPRVTLD